MNKKLMWIIFAIIIVIWIIMFFTKGFNKELGYLKRNQIVITSEKTIDLSEIKVIAKEVLQTKNIKVQEVDRFRKINWNYCRKYYRRGKKWYCRQGKWKIRYFN